MKLWKGRLKGCSFPSGRSITASRGALKFGECPLLADTRLSRRAENEPTRSSAIFFGELPAWATTGPHPAELINRTDTETRSPRVLDHAFP